MVAQSLPVNASRQHFALCKPVREKLFIHELIYIYTSLDMHVFLVLGEVDGWISSFFPLNTEKVLGKQTSCHISTHNVTLDFLKQCKHFCF